MACLIINTYTCLAKAYFPIYHMGYQLRKSWTALWKKVLTKSKVSQDLPTYQLTHHQVVNPLNELLV